MDFGNKSTGWTHPLHTKRCVDANHLHPDPCTLFIHVQHNTLHGRNPYHNCPYHCLHQKEPFLKFSKSKTDKGTEDCSLPEQIQHL